MIKIRLGDKESVRLPPLAYVGYSVTKFFDELKRFSLFLDKVESSILRMKLRKININKPVFITGLARSGTTIMLEMLNKHPDLVSHQYKHLVLPYLPFVTGKIVKIMNIYTKPFERIHMDGIYVTQESPEAVEEIFWQKFFRHLHDEKENNILNQKTHNKKFESFYRLQIKKLLLEQKTKRYLAKNNYNCTRLKYILKLFPDARILIMIRNPVNQIASLMKQTNLFINLESQVPIFMDWINLMGHHEFGQAMSLINVGNNALIREIRDFWKKNPNDVKAWAYYWNAIYQYLANILEEDESLRKAVKIIRYGDLCENSGIVIDEILSHLDLSKENFKIQKKYYCKYLHKPSYYEPKFSNDEIKEINNITYTTARRFGFR
ncbi:MAG: hypothetical protein GF317_19515 [Candidatus Lokiarchaeota archaeon]|nr:hypothetical protein [Candidatus Lokiarchaeota archaeon]MBD3201685.1 hypothetical protein [Candidatus Lokiarchaeota archaeon]